MSVIGIDFGNDSCYVAVAKAGGIETIDNDYSLRATPSFVAFGERSRILGVAAKNQMVMNVKNTLYGFKRFVGRNFNDPFVEDEASRYMYNVTSNEAGRVAFRVDCHQESKLFTPEQVTAMLFTKLKQTSEVALGLKVSDCVISCPSYFTDSERCSMLDAASMAGLNVLRLMNDSTATALNYGMYKQDIIPAPEEPPRNVVFVDFGHSGFQVFAVAFNKGKLKVIASCADPSLGGRNFDEALANYFCEEFRTKYNVDAKKHPKAYLRLLAEVEKLKKQMSANSTKLPISLECFINEKDVSSSMQRPDFEQLCAPLFVRAEEVMKQCLQDSGLSPDAIEAVEIVGGSTRIPAIKGLIEKVFKKAPSTTLNQDEAVARGCALQCAILSPNFKVKEVSITDVHPYGVNVTYVERDNSEGVMEVFPRYHPVPFSRKLTFYRKEPFQIKASYISKVNFPVDRIGVYKFSGVKPTPEGEAAKVQIKARINLHGCFVIDSACEVQKQEIEVEEQMETDSEPQPNANTGEEKMEESKPEGAPDANAAQEQKQPAEKKTVKVKKIVGKNVDLKFERTIFGLKKEELNLLIEEEARMVAEDQFEKERIDAKNALEEYIYDMRNKLDDELCDYVDENRKSELTQRLSYLENWLYEDGENEQKKVYASHLDELKKNGEPIKELKREYEGNPRLIQEFEALIQKGRKVLWSRANNEATYEHLDPKDLDEITKAVEEAEKWLESARQSLNVKQKFAPPSVRSTDISSQIKAYENRLFPLINKKKPDPAKQPPSTDAAPNAGQEGDNVVNGGKTGDNPDNMEVD